MKAAELMVLDGEELTAKLKESRRELYELRFKLAVGQLENNRQIRRVRKDIARILTVVHQRRWDMALEPGPSPEVADAPEAADVDATGTEVVAATAADTETVASDEVETAPPAAAAVKEPSEAPAGRRRGRRANSEEGE